MKSSLLSRSLLAAALALSATAASAVTISDTLGTLALGAPFPRLPLCADVRTPDGERYTALCADTARSDRSLMMIGFPEKLRPDIMDGNRAVAVVDGTSLVGLVVPTQGAKSDAKVLAALTKAFGKPMRVEQEQVAGAGGRMVSATHAGWIRAPMTVEMYAIPDQPDTGTVELLTDAARPLMAAPSAASAAGAAPRGAASAPAAKPRQGW
ncbi:hypothetical protein MW7_002995 [Imbroritus primus]|uniref:Uncharacterized protein n=1 Tax=Imbroritus primus TaxID=3058603 RepID=A0ACD3SSG6_9BURK|nr:hypothetical protein MW7_002995 [Burkholderiaceae bacterium PBA]